MEPENSLPCRQVPATCPVLKNILVFITEDLMICDKYEYGVLYGNKEYFYMTAKEVSVSIYVAFYASLGEVHWYEIYCSKDLMVIFLLRVYGLDERQKSKGS
jgi:hypothetical protein